MHGSCGREAIPAVSAGVAFPVRRPACGAFGGLSPGTGHGFRPKPGMALRGQFRHRKRALGYRRRHPPGLAEVQGKTGVHPEWRHLLPCRFECPLFHRPSHAGLEADAGFRPLRRGGLGRRPGDRLPGKEALRRRPHQRRCLCHRPLPAGYVPVPENLLLRAGSPGAPGGLRTGCGRGAGRVFHRYRHSGGLCPGAAGTS